MVCHFLLQRIIPTQVSHIVGSLPSEPPGKSLVQLLSLVRLFATLWTVACHASLSMGFSQARILQWVEGDGTPTPVLLPGKSHEWRSLVGCSQWGREELDTTERLHFHFSLPCTGEGYGNPLQCSCLENPRKGGAWWAAVYGVAQSQTRLK